MTRRPSGDPSEPGRYWARTRDFGMRTPVGVRAYERRGERERMIFILNFTETSQTIAFPLPCRDAFTRAEVHSVEIPAVDLRIVVTE